MGWTLLIGGICALVMAPLLVILMAWRRPAFDIWRHLHATILADLLVNTLVLAAGVCFFSALLGISLAWLTAMCDFPGRRLFSRALLLPMAMPGYVLAVAVLGLLDYGGPVAALLRGVFGPEAPVPSARSTPVIIGVLSLTLYPYVYLLARNAFLTQGQRMLEAARTLGADPWRAFFKVVLPMARPSIAGGIMLVLMETLADFGTVSAFNFDTFTTAIYKAWYGFFSLPAAAQLSSCLVTVIFAVVLMEQRLRRRRRYAESRPAAPGSRIGLRGGRRWLACAYAGGVLCAGLLIPAAQLAYWAVGTFREEFNARYLSLLYHSLKLGLLGAAVVVVAALGVAYGYRRRPGSLHRGMVGVANLGYALPGPVLAVGLFIPFIALDRRLSMFFQEVFGSAPSALLTGTLLTMLLAYLVRFFAVGFKTVDGAMHRIPSGLDEAARLMGHGGFSRLRRLHLPLLKNGLFTAATLVLVDIMKEMPITLMTRPFGVDTLAIKIFELTSEGEWERAAWPALTLLAAGLLPIALFMCAGEGRGGRGRGRTDG
jgi:iron(III) transport system permease protein